MFSKICTFSEKKLVFFVDKSFLALSIFLFWLPVAFGYRFSLKYRLLGLIPLICVIFLNLHYIRKYKIAMKLDIKLTLLLGLFSFLWILAILRTAVYQINYDTFYNLETLFSILIFGFFIFSTFIANHDIDKQKQLSKSIIYAFGLYITMNLVLYLIGVNPPNPFYLAKYPTQILNFLGLPSYRVFFPLSEGINNFGCLVGAILVGLYQLLKTRKNKGEGVFISILLFACIIAVLLTDSKGAIIFVILSIAIMSLHNKIFIFIRWTPFLISIIPLIASVFTPNLLEDSTSWLNRSKSEMIEVQEVGSEQSCQTLISSSSGALTNRTIIWKFVVNDLEKFKIIHLVGYGFRGHMISGISRNYACLFSSYTNSIYQPSHNIWLQLILDIGYFGVIITIVLLGYLILKLSRLFVIERDYGYFAFLNILIYLISVGSLGSSISPDWYSMFILLIFIAASILPKHHSLKT